MRKNEKWQLESPHPPVPALQQLVTLGANHFPPPDSIFLSLWNHSWCHHLGRPFNPAANNSG